MRKHFCTVLVTLALNAATIPIALGQFYSGHNIIDGARETARHNQGGQVTDYWSEGKFTGYVVAVFDIATFEGAICPGSRVSVGQVASLAAANIVDNPQNWDRPAFYVVLELLEHHFPCNG